MRRVRTIVRRTLAMSIAVTLSFAAPSPAAAQQGPRAWTLEEDNDALAVWLPSRHRTDDNYTQGLRVTVAVNAPDWTGARLLSHAPLCTPGSDPNQRCRSAVLAVGQEIYTPTSRADPPPPDDRPYAAWLHAGLTHQVSTAGERRALGIEVGMTGPPALGEEVQNILHKVANVGPQRPAWDHQIAFQPGVIVRFGSEYFVHAATSSVGDLLQVIPRWSIGVGNVLNAATAGVGLRLGYRLDHPWRASGATSPSWNAYLLGDFQGQWVVTNAFLDGTSFGNDPHVSKRPFTSQYMLGVALRIHSFTLELRGVTEGREFDGGPGAHRYGTIALGFHLPR